MYSPGGGDSRSILGLGRNGGSEASGELASEKHRHEAQGHGGYRKRAESAAAAGGQRHDSTAEK